jgi:hypothetical protein
MHFNSKELITFRTRFEVYIYKVLSFGLTNGPAIYQYYINDILFDYLDDFYTAYLNNILIYSDNKLEHEYYIRKILEKLRNTGLQINLKKYEFYIIRTKYLEFIININGIEINPEKISVVKNWKPPIIIKDI